MTGRLPRREGEGSGAMPHYDKLEVRSPDERAADISRKLPALVAGAKAGGLGEALRDVDPQEIGSAEALAGLPVLRKSDVGAMQKRCPPLGGLVPGSATDLDYLFQSPGPIYEPGSDAPDWWRMGRFLHACGFGRGDIVQNCFSYHLTPAGTIFESGARAVGATVIPAGTGNTELQAKAAAHLGATAYAGTPDFLKVLLETADGLGLDLSAIAKAAVGGGALFPSLRSYYADRGISCLQSYSTAELGSIAYETVPDEGLVVDEGVIVEIVTPGTGNPVEPGTVGEVIVTLLNPDFPLVRFATGDLSAFLPGASPCGRTNVRIAGWKGRADQTTKIKGMFVRPEQVADFTARHPEIAKARIEVVREGEMDAFTLRIEADGGGGEERYVQSAQEILKVRGKIEICRPGTLPNDGKVIDDQRDYS